MAGVDKPELIPCSRFGGQIGNRVQRSLKLPENRSCLLLGPGRPLALVEIKSAAQVRENHARGLASFLADFPEADCFLLSRDPNPQRFVRIQALPWEEGLPMI